MLWNHIRTIIQSWQQQRKTSQQVSRTVEEFEFQPGYLEIAERPPSPWARRIALLLTLTLAAALAWSILGELDIHAGATGRLIVSSHSKDIQSIEAGEIAAIHVNEGQAVKAGDPLISLNPLGIDAEITELKEQLKAQRLLFARMQALLSEHPLESFQAPPDIAPEHLLSARHHLEIEWREMQANLDKLSSDITINEASQNALSVEISSLEALSLNVEERLQAWRTLAAEKLHPKMQLLEQTREQLEADRMLNKQRAELSVLQAQHNNLNEQIESYLARFNRENFDKLTDARVEVAVLEQKLLKAQEKKRLMTLRSPVDGVVQQLVVHTVGGVVQPAQVLMVVVPEGAPLEAEVMVLNKDVGFVQGNQNVEIKVDSFPYTRYGTITGKLLHVSKDAVEHEQMGLVFPARVSLSQRDIQVEDETVPLQAGMSLVAEIHTGKRRVIDYLLSPLMQYKSEALRER